MNELKEQIGNRLNKIVQDNQMSHIDVKKKVEDAGNKTISQPTIKRYLSGETEQTASFILSFCRAFGVSADEILGLNTSVIHSETVTPFIVLRNLFLLLNQFDFNIEFDKDGQKAMITSNNEYMVNFLLANKTLKNLTLDQIDSFCETYQLVMLGKTLVTKKQYDLHYKSLYIEKELEKDRIAEYNGINMKYRDEEAQEIENKERYWLGNKKLTREEVLAIKWNRFSEKEKEAHIKEIEEEITKTK